MEEVFKDIPGYEGIYQVSDLGTVKSLPREICNHRGCHISKERILKPSIDIFGYKFVVLFVKNKQKTIKVHQLIAMAFLGHKPCGMKIVVDHINGKRDDNNLYNLQLISQRENCHKKRDNYSSNYKGIYFHKASNKWLSQIYIKGIKYYLGLFKTELEASEAYQNKLKQI